MSKANQITNTVDSFHSQQTLSQLNRDIKNSAQIFFKRANTYTSLGQYQHALEDYTQAIKLNNHFSVAFCHRGILLQKIGKQEEALVDHNRALELNPQLELALVSRGTAYHHLGMHEQALKDYNQALESDNNNIEGLLSRGITQFDLQNYDAAIKDLTKAIKIDPKYTDALVKRGITFKNMGKCSQAIKDFSQALALSPNNAEAYLNRGSAYAFLNNAGQALANFNKALSIAPQNPLGLLKLGQFYQKSGEIERAIDLFKKCIEVFSSESKATIKSKHNISGGNIAFAKGTINQYKILEQKLTELEVEAKKISHGQILKHVPGLRQKNEKLIIEAVKDIDSSHPQRAKSQYNHSLSLEDIKNKHGRLSRMLLASKDKTHERLDLLEKKVEEMSRKVMATDRVLLKIGKLGKKRAQYYNMLYHMIVCHFLGYRTASSGFFTQDSQKFKDSTMSGAISAAQSIASYIPGLGNTLQLPFQLLNTYQNMKANTICADIAGKVSLSNFITQTQVNSTVAITIQKLIGNVPFNQQLIIALDGSKKDFLNILSRQLQQLSKFTNIQNFIISNAFGENSISLVQQMVTTHMTLITKVLHQCPPDEFDKATQNPRLFYQLIAKAICPPSEQNQDLMTKFNKLSQLDLNNLNVDNFQSQARIALDVLGVDMNPQKNNVEEEKKGKGQKQTCYQRFLACILGCTNCCCPCCQ